jgi:3-hydroxyacyl-[acyl-carrier-protein] dehydratase
VQFCLIDQILELEPGQSITAIKNLTMGEEYLAEHFPSFPVMPGVLMLEAIVQAAGWMIRVGEGFKHNLVVLKEARNVKYGQFVVPGNTLRLTVEKIDEDGNDVSVKAKGELDGKTSVSAKVIVAKFNLRDRHPVFRKDDLRLRAHLLGTFRTLATPALREKLQNRSAGVESSATG